MLGCLLAAVSLSAPGQERDTTAFRSLREEFSPLLSGIAPFLLPKIVADGYRLKEFIRSEEFAGIRSAAGDRRAVDAIFDRAMTLSWNNVHEALLITFFGVMDHKKFGVRMPLLGEFLWVPLTSEFEEDFRARVRALPSRLYDDTPQGAYGDRDKLQHFFGSALLSYVTGSAAAAERVGYFIEWGEDLFIVGGVYDERDLRANRQGQEFARSLSEDDAVNPSTFFVATPVPAPGSRPRRAVPPDSIHVAPEAP
jgi:hypothetical protein